MAILANMSGKAKERVRVHAQLGAFPLLTEATVVRMSKTKQGYRWALRFDCLDDRMRANLETFVRQQLANAARVRQAQLYAARMKSGPIPATGVPTPEPDFTSVAPSSNSPISSARPPAAQRAMVQSGPPQHPLVPTPPPVGTNAGSSDATTDADDATPDEDSIGLDVEHATPEPGSATASRPVIEIELPDMEPMSEVEQMAHAAADRSPNEDPSYEAFQAYTPEENDEASLLGEGPLATAAPADAPPVEAPVAAAEPASVPEATPAETLTPGVYEIEEGEDLSLEDILAEIEDGDEAAAPASAMATLVGDGAPAPIAAVEVPLDPPRSGATLVADHVPVSPSLDVSGAPLHEASGDDALLLDAADAPLTPAPGSLGTPVAPESEPGPPDEAPGFSMSPAPPEEAPGFSMSPAPPEEAPGFSMSPAPDEISTPPEEAPGFSMSPAPDEAPVLAGAPGLDQDEPEDDAPGFALVEAPSAPESVRPTMVPTEQPAASPQSAPPPSVEDAPSQPVEDARRTMHGHASTGTPSPAHDIGGAPFDPLGSESDDGSLGSVGPKEAGPSGPAPEADAPRTPTPPPASPVYPDDVAPFDPYASNPAPQLSSSPVEVGSAPRTIGELPPPVAGLYTPASNPSLREDSGAYQHASFEPFDSPTEANLYEEPSGVSFEERRDDPRQRLASLQVDDKSPHKLADQHSLYLGDIEGVTSNLTPTDAKLKMTDEVLDEPGSNVFDGEVPPQAEPAADTEEIPAYEDVEEYEEVEPDAYVSHHGTEHPVSHDLPTSVDAGAVYPAIDSEPTQPVDLVPAAELTPAPQELEMDDLIYEDDADTAVARTPPPAQQASPTSPGFNVVPDFDQAPQNDGPEPSAPHLMPAQTGNTIVASVEMLGLLRPPPNEEEPGAPAQAPSDFSVLPTFGQQANSGFTVVASFDEEPGPADVGGGTMVASAEDVEAWKNAGMASTEVAQPSPDPVVPEQEGFDDERTSYFTPLPGALPSAPEEGNDATTVRPADPASMAVMPPGLGDPELTAMRVGPSPAPPSDGAGLELNPGGPAPQHAQPGPAPRRATRMDPGGRPAPSPQPATRPAAPPTQQQMPQVRGSGPLPPAMEDGPTSPKQQAAAPQPSASAGRRSLVEDALAQLKKKTEAKRKQRGETTSEEPAKVEAAPKSNAHERRRKRLGPAEQADPKIAELYKAALTDVDS